MQIPSVSWGSRLIAWFHILICSIALISTLASAKPRDVGLASVAVGVAEVALQ